MAPGDGSGTGLRSTTSNQVKHPWLKAHMAMPVAIRAQKRRVWPRLSKAFMTERTKAATITSNGTMFPMLTRKRGLGNTEGARAKASSRLAPQTRAEMWLRDIMLHHMMFGARCLDDGQVTRDYFGNPRIARAGSSSLRLSPVPCWRWAD